MRRAVGYCCVAVGVALVLVAGLNYLRGAVARDRVRTAWEQARARGTVTAIGRALDGALPNATHPGAPVARLVIPGIALDEVVVEGVGDDELNAGPGHIPGTALPGEQGNAVVSAHRDRHFHRFGELVPGDTVITETATQTVVWRITDRQVVHKDARVLFPSPTAQLTLTTCWPVRFFGPAPDRLILTAEPIREAAVAIARSGE